MHFAKRCDAVRKCAEIQNGEKMYTIGIDLGGTNVAVGLCDSELNMIKKISRPTVRGTADDIVKEMADICKDILKETGLTVSDIEYVGVTAPGTVSEDGVVEYASNLPFTNYNIRERFKELLPVGQVYSTNDANAAALGELVAGAGRGATSLVMLTLGTGVGGGVVLGGKIFSGGLNTSGTELGHTVIVRGGRPCGCGRCGCLETYASATGLKLSTLEKIEECRKNGRHTAMLAAPWINARTAFDAAKQGDEAAIEVVNEFIDYLAIGATNMVNIFQPEILLIGGGISGEGEYLIAPLREKIDREQYTNRNEVRTKIMKVTLGNDAGIIGAAALGRRN